MIHKVKITEVKTNTANPRIIKDSKCDKLKTSLKEFPEMLRLRPIVVDENNIILGGNMRYKACQELKFKEVYIVKADDLTEKQKQEFIIKDNVGFGEWDWDILANQWDNVQLKDWGMDVWQPEEDVDYSILDDIDLGETLEEKTDGVKRALMIEFEAGDYDEANELISKARKDGQDVGRVVLNAFKNL
jgi:hypothetical protein